MKSLVNVKSISQIGAPAHYVDIVRDVINLLPIYWLSEEVVRAFETLCVIYSDARFVGRLPSQDRCPPPWAMV